MKRKLKISKRDLKWTKQIMQSFHVNKIGRHNSVEEEIRFNIEKSAEQFINGLDTEQCYINDNFKEK